jgi:hypothetical protein
LARKANRNPSVGRTYAVTFLPHEFKRFKRYPVNPKPDSKIGGEQGMVNWIFDNTDRATLVCVVTPDRLERWIGYIKRYGNGGPNKILRETGIPALRRIGIDLLPEWR